MGTCFGNEALQEAQGLNSCYEGVGCGAQHLWSWVWQWDGGGQTKKSQGSQGNRKEENGRSGQKTRQVRKQIGRMARKGPNSRLSRRACREKKAKQNVGNPRKQEGKGTESIGQGRASEGNRELSGKERRRGGEGSQEEDSRGNQNLVKTPPERIGNWELLDRASDPDKNQAGRVHQVGHISQQVDGCQNGHSQAAVPGAHVVDVTAPAARILAPL